MRRELLWAVAVEIIGIIVILAGILALLVTRGPTPASVIAFGSALVALGSLWLAKIYRGGMLREEVAGTR